MSDSRYMTGPNLRGKARPMSDSVTGSLEDRLLAALPDTVDCECNGAHNWNIHPLLRLITAVQRDAVDAFIRDSDADTLAARIAELRLERKEERSG